MLDCDLACVIDSQTCAWQPDSPIAIPSYWRSILTLLHRYEYCSSAVPSRHSPSLNSYNIASRDICFITDICTAADSPLARSIQSLERARKTSVQTEQTQNVKIRRLTQYHRTGTRCFGILSIEKVQRKSHTTFNLIHNSVHGLVFKCAAIMSTSLVCNHLTNTTHVLRPHNNQEAKSHSHAKSQIRKPYILLTDLAASCTSCS